MALRGSTMAVLDALLASGWVVVALDNLVRWRADRRARAEMGAVAAAGWTPPAPLRALVLAATFVAFVALERMGGVVTVPAAVRLAGLVLAWTGVALHLVGRRALGPAWSAPVSVRTGQAVVDRGPYAVVRHPLYAAALLLAVGTVLAHPSTATLCLAVGLAAGIATKIRVEERALRAVCGDAYARYAARVPALVPRWASLRAALSRPASR